MHSIEDYRGLIKSLAYRYRWIPRADASYEYDDLLALGEEAFVRAVNYDKNNPSNGKFSTLLYTFFQRDLSTLAKQVTRRKNIAEKVEYNDELNGKRSWAYQLAELPEDVKTIAELIIDAPQELIDFIPSVCSGLDRELLSWYLRRKKNWKQSRINDALNLIRKLESGEET